MTKNIKIALKKSKFNLTVAQKNINKKYSNKLPISKIVKIYLQIPNINSDIILDIIITSYDNPNAIINYNLIMQEIEIHILKLHLE